MNLNTEYAEKNLVQGKRGYIRYLIYPRFQLILIAVNSVVTLTVLGVVYFQISRMFSHFHELGSKIELSADHTYFQLLDAQSAGIYSSLIIALCLGIIISAILTLILSHRIAGPMVKMRNYFDSITHNGVVNQELEFRKNDFFRDLPEKINQALKKLTKKS